jgi:hypothetical protein
MYNQCLWQAELCLLEINLHTSGRLSVTAETPSGGSQRRYEERRLLVSVQKDHHLRDTSPTEANQSRLTCRNLQLMQ